MRPTLPPWLIAAVPAILGGIAAALTGALVIGPFLLPVWMRTLSKADRERLLAQTLGAYKVAASIAAKTPSSLDDDVAKILKMVADEAGRSLKDDEKRFVEGVARATHADPSKPNLSPE